MRAAVERLPAHERRGLAWNADREQHLAVDGTLPHRVVTVVSAVQMIVSVDVEPVRAVEEALAPALDEVAVAVEDHHRMGATVEHIDAIPAVDGDGGDILEVPAVRQLRPILNHAIAMLARAQNDRHGGAPSHAASRQSRR